MPAACSVVRNVEARVASFCGVHLALAPGGPCCRAVSRLASHEPQSFILLASRTARVSTSGSKGPALSPRVALVADPVDPRLVRRYPSAGGAQPLVRSDFA